MDVPAYILSLLKATASVLHETASVLRALEKLVQKDEFINLLERIGDTDMSAASKAIESGSPHTALPILMMAYEKYSAQQNSLTACEKAVSTAIMCAIVSKSVGENILSNRYIDSAKVAYDRYAEAYRYANRDSFSTCFAFTEGGGGFWFDEKGFDQMIRTLNSGRENLRSLLSDIAR